MEITINGKVVQYNMDFRKEYPNIFKILTDEDHEVFYIQNIEAEDLVVFLSPNQNLLETVYMSEFERYLRKLNKKLFFNILSLFTDSFDIEDESNEIAECKLVNKDEFLKGFKSNYRFKKTNVIFKKNTCEFYISPSQEIGTTYDIEAVQRKNAFIEKINALNSSKESKLFYNLPTKKLMVINVHTGTINPVNLELNEEETEYLADFPKVKDTWHKTYFCDAREFLKICKDKERPVEDCNFFVSDETLYVCFVTNHYNFKTLSDVAKHLYNNQNTRIIDKLKEKTHSQDFVYMYNGERNDCILYRSGKTLKAKTLEELNLEENYSDVMSAFQKEDIIDIKQLKVPYLLFLKMAKLQDAPEKAIETSKYVIWADFFSKTLFAARKD